MNIKNKKEENSFFQLIGEEAKKDYFFGRCCYDIETEEGKKIFSLDAARKYNLEELEAIMFFISGADDVDIIDNEIHIASFNNILKAIEEQTPLQTPEEKEEIAKSFEEFKTKYQEFFEEFFEE